MGFEGFSTSNWSALGRHKRSKSLPRGRQLDQSTGDDHQRKMDTGEVNDSTKSNKKQSSNAKLQDSMRQEILQLEKKLHEEVSVRFALENALSYTTLPCDINETTISKPATELIKEIALLEVEVSRLEQHLLSLYRKAFDPKISSKRYEIPKSPLTTTPRRRRLDFSKTNVSSSREKSAPKETSVPSEEKILEASVQRCHSSLSQGSFLANRISPHEDASCMSTRACNSQPLSMMENSSPRVISLVEHFGARISDYTPITPNKLSEEMVKCMSKIYYKLSDPPLLHNELYSPTSSSTSAFSPKNLWSPGFKNDFSFDVRLDNPFQVEGLKDFSGPYCTMVEIHRIYRDKRKLEDVEYLLQDFRSLISRLEAIDPRKMSHEEKLAFWINIHNALVMHAFLAHGIPQSNMKRMFLLMKAAYIVGGQVVSADAIQNSILGCRMSRPGQWVRFLFSSRTKFKARHLHKAYVMQHPEPLLHFALSSGSHSDPAVRIYTPKRVFEELEAAKEDYIRATFGVRKKDRKIVLPKIVESYAKDSGLCDDRLMEMVKECLPDYLRKSVKKSRKKIEWIPHNFGFRYLILKELVK